MLHPDEECSAFLILNIRDPYLATKTYDALSERVRTGRMAQYMDSHISYLKKEILFNEKMKSLQPGMPAPLFALKDPKGKTIRLEKLRGKWLVLDFWGSWCFWCLHGVPKMREIYEKYPGKFQILGVDCNDTDKKWRDAMSKNNMPWMHVYDPVSTNSKGEELEKSVAYMYAVNGFPTKVIIRPDGNIERFFYGEKEEFYEYLENLVK